MQKKHLTKFNILPWFKKKTLNKVGIEGTHLIIVKPTYDSPTANIKANVEKMKAFPLKSGKDKCAHCHRPIRQSAESPSQSSQTRKKSKTSESCRKK